MKILLINPPRSPENKILEYASDEAKYFIHKKLIGPPLGLLTIAAKIKDFDVTVFDTKGEYDLDPKAPPLEKLITDLLNKINPDIVGVTFIASELYSGLEILRTVKKYSTDILTVAGGLHATLCPDDFTDKSIDIVCPGQSDNAFRQIVISKEKNNSFDHIDDILINSPDGLIATKASGKKYRTDNDEFIIPDRNLLKRWKPTYKVRNNPFPVTYLFTSQGCPYSCSFCSIWPQFQGKFHQRSIESIIDELKMINDYKIVRFADANTIVSIKFINKLFDRISEEGIKKEFIMDIRADTAAKNPKLIEKLARGGLKVVICGFESIKQEELEQYNKGYSVNIIRKAIDIFHQNEIMLRGNYVIPNDYTKNDFKALSEYANSHKVAYAGYTILTPMPGTVYYNQVKDQIIDNDLSKYNFFNSVMKTKLPLETFYKSIAELWLIKKGTDVI